MRECRQSTSKLATRGEKDRALDAEKTQLKVQKKNLQGDVSRLNKEKIKSVAKIASLSLKLENIDKEKIEKIENMKNIEKTEKRSRLFRRRGASFQSSR